MNADIMKGIVKTITDGIKDSEMQYEYAVTAKNAGKTDLAALHIEEAKNRLGKVKEWYERAVAMENSRVDEIAELLMERYREWYHAILDKVLKFKV